MAGNAYNNHFLSGKEGRLNGQIIRYLAINGPSLIYSIAKQLQDKSETKVHYATVNRRVHDLESRKYIQKSGSRATKAGIDAALYSTTIKGDFAALALDLTPSEELLLLLMAGRKEGSPFLLMNRMIGKGLPREFVQKELLQAATEGVKNGYINLEALHDEVICSAFSAIIARRLRVVLGDENGRKYVQTVKESIESIIFPPRVILQSDIVTNNNMGRPAPSRPAQQAGQADNEYRLQEPVMYRPITYSNGWIGELYENIKDMTKPL